MSTSRRIISEETRTALNRDAVTVPAKDPRENITQLPRPSYELGDLLVSYLEQLGVDYVFGIPGGAIEPLYNALARSERRGGPRAVVARHETGAAFMADGYARNSGKLGVCCGTAGPGTTNLITGVASAYDNNSPLLVITAQTAITNFGKCAAQESGDTGINTVAMFEHCTHYSTLISHADQFERKLTSAIMHAVQAPQGPAHLSIPLDVFRSIASVTNPSYELKDLLRKTSLVDDESLAKLSQELLDSKRTVFIVGDQCSDAIPFILDIALMLNIEIVSTPHAKGLVSPYHPLFRGVIGFAGHKSATEAVSNHDIDLIVAIGTTLSETASNNWDKSVLNNKLIHIDSAECNFAGSPMARLHVRGDISTVCEKLLDLLNVKLTINPSLEKRRANIDEVELLGEKGQISERHFEMENEDQCVANSVPIKPQRLMNDLPMLFPPNTHYLCDSGNSMVWSIHYLHPYDRRIKSRRAVLSSVNTIGNERNNGRRSLKGSIFWTCLEYGSMGWAIGSSIGTALACPNDPVVCITGDGAMLMSGGDITVALQEKLNVIFIILNDAEYGMVKQGQRMGSGEPVGYKLPRINFVKWGKSMGIPGYYVHTPKDLGKLDIDKLIGNSGPKILDVYVDPEEEPPIRNRLKALGTVD